VEGADGGSTTIDLDRTRGSFGHDTTSGAAVMPGQTARIAAFVGACAMSAAAGFALGGLLRGRNGSDGSSAGRLAATKRRLLG
jgi:hypothetical protein